MAKDLTTGKITPLLVRFTIPLVLGNIFQLTYNAVDSIIVGHFIGKEALAAVGICSPIMTMIILFLNGLCMGASILMGTQFGAKDYDTLNRQISTTMLAGVIFSLSLSIVCILLAVPILTCMQVDASIMTLTTQYMRIIFMGLVFTYLYNFFSSTLRALGDAKTPLYFLMISSVFNIFGDLFFIVVLHMGSMGCAISTVISEALSCVFCLIHIQRAVPILQLGRKWMVFDHSLLRQTISYGWASAMQQATIPLAKIAIQAVVNTLGVSAAAAFAVVNRIDDFAYTPEQNIGHAMTALMAQNRGAGKRDRMRAGFRCGMMLEAIYGVIVLLIGFFFARQLMMLFVSDEEVITHGVRYLRLIAFFYLLPAATNGIQGYFRGVGRLKLTLRCSIINSGVRVAAAFLLVLAFHMGIEALPISYMFGWIAMLIAEVPILVKNYRELGQPTS
ncbi:MAG: MATE family efflux transporter [Clostridiales bacterium]|nr:MATE family efflux transporter [Clostridiales bacterium]